MCDYKTDLTTDVRYCSLTYSVNGDVRFWDPRFSESVKLIQPSFNTLTAMAVHPQANIFAW